MTTETSSLILPAPSSQVLHPTVQAELTDFRSFLDERLVGQEEAKAEAVEVLAQIRNPLRDPKKRSIRSFLRDRLRSVKRSCSSFSLHG